MRPSKTHQLFNHRKTPLVPSYSSVRQHHPAAASPHTAARSPPSPHSAIPRRSSSLNPVEEYSPAHRRIARFLPAAPHLRFQSIVPPAIPSPPPKDEPSTAKRRPPLPRASRYLVRPHTTSLLRRGTGPKGWRMTSRAASAAAAPIPP